MARNAAGTYSLPAGNPVTPGTTITSNWANSTLTDIRDALTDSLSRTGKGGMASQFRAIDGTAAAPGMTFSQDLTTGLWRPSAGGLEVSVGNTPGVRFGANGRLRFGTADRMQFDSEGVLLGSQATDAGSGYLVAQPSFRNRLVNGGMRINQRALASYTITNAGLYTLDRWYGQTAGLRVLTVSQDTDAPAGFSHSLRVDCTTQATALGPDLNWIGQGIEGSEIGDLRWGTADAQPVTISFWVKASAVGTYSAFLLRGDLTQSYVATFTVDNAGVWERKKLTINGPTTGGLWPANPSSAGMYFGIDFNSGPNFVSVGNAWEAGRKQRTAASITIPAASVVRFTGVQLERGAVASAFERQTFALELVRCQRYYEKSYAYEVAPSTATAIGRFFGSTNGGGLCFETNMYQTQKAALPNLVLYDLAGNVSKLTSGGAHQCFFSAGGLAIGTTNFNVDAIISFSNNVNIGPNAKVEFHWTAETAF